MANYYCEYCGTKAQSISHLTATVCAQHPNGHAKGKHKLYEGSEKSSYNCKYCGTSANSLTHLTATACPKHPNGHAKGKHAPTL